MPDSIFNMNSNMFAYVNDMIQLDAGDFVGSMLDDAKSVEVSKLRSMLNPATSLDEYSVDDIRAAIFYSVNCMQEYNPSLNSIGDWGRFRFDSSFQFGFNSIIDNRVKYLIEELSARLNKQAYSRKSQLFISHDIDYLYHSKKEDLKWAAKNWRIGDLVKIIFQEVINKPIGRNIDKVIKLDSAHAIRSTFFWLVNDSVGEFGIPNADYELKKEFDLVKAVSNANCFNGLHKSATSDSINQELNKSGYNWTYNRNHFLKFQIHDHWKAIAESNIKLDCSLGFAEHFGFRNSYGKPFRPYDFANECAYDFVEMPLHVMDATFKHYLDTEPSKIGSTVISFIEQNKYDCVLSILWHNNYLTEYSYKPFFRAYKEILTYIYESRFSSVTPEEILQEYLNHGD